MSNFMFLTLYYIVLPKPPQTKLASIGTEKKEFDLMPCYFLIEKQPFNTFTKKKFIITSNFTNLDLIYNNNNLTPVSNHSTFRFGNFSSVLIFN